MAIYMLDHDPRAAARAHADQHLDLALNFVVQQLANAWHELYSNWSLPLDVPEHEYNVVRRVVSDAAHPRPAFPLQAYIADGPVRPGDPVVWLLMGQRIPQKSNEMHASGLWIRQLGGNYRWAWRFGVALLDEFNQLRIPIDAKIVRRTRALYTLEALPPPLQGTEGDWSEAPLTMPNIFRQERDGFYNSVESWRLFYGSKYGPEHYSRRRAPDWLEEANTQAKQLTDTAHGEA